MTTIAVDFRNQVIAADTQNTDETNAIFRVHKIERLKDGRYFLGSGHNLMIDLAKKWAETHFDPKKAPDWPDGPGLNFSAIVIEHVGGDWEAVLVDDEKVAFRIYDPFTAIGSGAAYAIGAMAAGADARTAVEIACRHDIYTSAPIDWEEFHLPKATAPQPPARRKPRS